MDHIIKELSATIEFIKDFQQNVMLKKLPFTDKEATLSIKDRKIELSFKLNPRDEIDNYYRITSLDSFTINKNGIHYKVYNHSGIIKDNFDYQPQIRRSCHIDISHMMDERWNKKDDYYYRFILPIEDVFGVSDINTYCYQIDKTQNKGLIEIAFNEGVIHLYHILIDNKKYIVIESGWKLTYDSMQRIVYVVALSLGLVTSIIPFDYAYIIASTSKDFSKDSLCGFLQMRPTIKGQFKHFTTNMYSLQDCLKRNGSEYALPQLYEGKEFLSHLQDWVQQDEFGCIVKMLYNNEDLARATLILIESSTVSLDYQGALCAVALETICSALEGPQDKSYMNNAEWKKQVLPAFDDLINNFETNNIVSKEHAGNMRKKLNSLNMRTNKDKLLCPFAQRNYKISKYEKEVIDNRNRFLHGHILGHCYKSSFQEIMYSCIELQKLCAILLFRESGFKGLVINNAVLLGLKQAIEHKEPILV